MEVGVKEGFTKILVRNTLKMAGHMERMGDEKLTNKAEVSKVQGKGRRGRPRLRWEDGVNRYLERMVEEWSKERKIFETIDRETSGRQLMENERRKTRRDVILASLKPDDRIQ